MPGDRRRTTVPRRLGAIAVCVTVLAACSLAISSCLGGAATGPCGPEISKSSGEEWVCTFSDDFGGSSLDPDKWQAMKTAETGFTQQSQECYVDDPATIKVADDVLKLTAVRLPGPTPCGSITSQAESAMIFTKHRFAQTYGRFEVRAKLPQDPGFQPALWMYPQEMAYGDRSGEIDIAESFGTPGLVSPRLHVHDASGVDHPTGADCQVANASEDFHTYVVEWLPSDGFRFLYDGIDCMTVPYPDPGAGLAAPQPFDKPFFMILQLALGYGANAPSPSTPFPRELTIDYVRAWK